MNKRDREILRELGRRVADIAALPAQHETISLWKALNSLKPARPMVMIDQIPWHEMDVSGELSLETTGDFSRTLETKLRRTIYAWTHMRVDMVVEPVVEIPKVIRGLDFGLKVVEDRAVTDPTSDIVGHHYVDQIPHEADLEKIRAGEPALDESATAEAYEEALEAFDGILEVKMRGRAPFFAPWDQIVQWRGAQNTLFDLGARPAFMHRMISRVVDANIAILNGLEEKGLLASGQGTVHCSGAYTDELPVPGFAPSHPRAEDVWTCGMAQVFASVSPAMHLEFELEYAMRWYSRFGLVYYGCCEPLDDRVDVVRRIPHLRKISMSPWVDVERGASRIGPDFVFSRKPSPALLAGDTWSSEAVAADLRNTMQACRRHGCPLEFILKDVSTVRYQPQRLWEWADVAMRVVGR